MRKVTHAFLNVTRFSKYKVIDYKEGGMGRVFILEKIDKQPGTVESHSFYSRRTQDKFKFIDRDLLAAKTIRSPDLRDLFLRELNIWISLTQPGIVPLLKVAKEDNELFGIMPAYEYNLREYIGTHRCSAVDCLKALEQCVTGLAEISDGGVLHLDLKPENLLVAIIDEQPQIDVSDWGLANVKMGIVRTTMQSDLRTIVGGGTIPYMSPERLRMVKPDYKSDIFSLGMIFYELLVGDLPYSAQGSQESQILSGQYFDRVQQMVGEKRIPSFLIEMLHPDLGKRRAEYKDVLKFLISLKGN